MTNAFFTNLSYVRMEEWRIFVVQECMKTPAKMAKYHIFWKFLAKKYCFGNKWQSTTFSRTWVAETQVPHQFCHYGTAELEFMWLKKIMWYLSLVNSSTMQHSTRVYQAWVPFIIKKKKKIYTVLEFGKLEYYVNFLFFFFFCLGIINK